MQPESKLKSLKHVQWDEEKLKETEKQRGCFEKINEPKTPYRKNSNSDEEELVSQKSSQEKELEDSLTRAKQNKQLNGHKKVNIEQLNARLKAEMERMGAMDIEETEQEESDRKRKEEFKRKRNQHYNEFKLVQKHKAENWEDDQ